MFNAKDIALWILAKNNSEIRENISEDEVYEVYEGITHLKLQKLLYYAQGIYLSLNSGRPMFEEKIVAWPHGPVVKEVYDIYSSNGRNEIVKEFTDKELEIIKKVELDENVNESLMLTYNNFAVYTAWQLRNKTHEIGAPWDVTRKTKGEGKVIDNKLIKEYFDKNVLEG